MSARQDAVQSILNELAWQGAFQISLKVHQGSIDALASDLLTDCARHAPAVGPGVTVLASHAQLRPNTLPGHYRNKTAIIYLVCMLEVFLKKVCTECLSLHNPPRMFGKLLCWPEVEHLMPGFGASDEVKRIHLVRLIRNAIVHHDGKVPPDFWNNPRRPQDSANTVIGSWCQDQAEFRRYYQPGSNVWLHIDRVVLPAVFCGIEFAKYVDFRLRSLGIA